MAFFELDHSINSRFFFFFSLEVLATRMYMEMEIHDLGGLETRPE